MTTSDLDSDDLINSETVAEKGDRLLSSVNYKEMLLPPNEKGHY